MSLRDFKEVFVFAAVTAVVVAGIFGTRTAMSEGPEIKGPEVTVEGCKLTASAAPAKEPYKVELTVKVENPSSQRRSFDLNLFVVRREFTGNLLSRVPGPSDNKMTLESDVKVKFNVPASGKVERKVTAQIEARPAPRPEKPGLAALSVTLPKAVEEKEPATMVEAATALTELTVPPALSIPPSYIISLDREGKNPVAFFSADMAWPKDSENAK